MKIVLRIMAIFLALIGLVALICGLAGQEISLGIVGGIAIILAICIFVFAGKKKKAKMADRQYIYMTDEQLASIEADHLPEIQVLQHGNDRLLCGLSVLRGIDCSVLL